MEKKKTTNVKIVTMCIFIATFMTAIEGTIISTALPRIVGSLEGIEIMNWVVSIYLLTNAMMTPIYGKLIDKIGRKPVFLVGILIFIVGSALSGMSQSMIQLIIFRAIQGAGAGAIVPVSLTIIADLYPVEKRANILGLNSAAWGIASIVGPLAGGFIVDTFSWHWIFLINVPIGIVLMGLFWVYMVEEDFEVNKEKIDFVGSFFMLIMLISLLLGVQTLSKGFSLFTLISLAIFVVTLFMFIRVEKRVTDPIISLDLFKNKTYVAVNIMAALIAGYLMAVEVYIPTWMQTVVGKSAMLGGIVLAPMSVIWMVGSFISGKSMKKYNSRQIILMGLIPLIAAGIGLIFVTPETPYAVFLGYSLVFGIGFGISMTILTVLAQSTVDSNQVGVATSFFTLSRTLGQTVMISIFGLVVNSTMHSAIANKKDLGITEQMMNDVINPEKIGSIPEHLIGEMRIILSDGIHNVFLVGLSLVIVTLIINQFKKRVTF
ncbi:MDR family MFS transporter [Vagococcus silagei]|uniref:DHA2 family efflux MFS transporter permease subunit n=1 Tax=Vagococcus silagei TaxID=2508885 RepID=A0A4S3B4C1_9ENTE|nr:MDR family MFS transporter [Vagococcus silagei]THB60266.1 DHA2 family efflux MFS transporter permease subunit [Vagococcus silagei]